MGNPNRGLAELVTGRERAASWGVSAVVLALILAAAVLFGLNVGRAVHPPEAPQTIGPVLMTAPGGSIGLGTSDAGVPSLVFYPPGSPAPGSNPFAIYADPITGDAVFQLPNRPGESARIVTGSELARAMNP